MYLSINQSIYLFIYPIICLSIYQSNCLFIYLSHYLSLYPTICHSIQLSVTLSTNLPVYLSISSGRNWCCAVCLYVENAPQATQCAVCDSPNYKNDKVQSNAIFILLLAISLSFLNSTFLFFFKYNSMLYYTIQY